MTINSNTATKHEMNSASLNPGLLTLACAFVFFAPVLTAEPLRSQLKDTCPQGSEAGITAPEHDIILRRFLAEEYQDPMENQELYAQYQQDCEDLYKSFSAMVIEGKLDELLQILREMPEGVRGGIATGLIATAFSHNRRAIGDPGLQLALATGITHYYERTPEVPIPLLAFPRRQVPHIMAAQPSSIWLVVREISRQFETDQDLPADIRLRQTDPGDKTCRQWLGEHIQSAIRRHPELLDRHPRAKEWADALQNQNLTPEDLMKQFRSPAKPSPRN